MHYSSTKRTEEEKGDNALSQHRDLKKRRETMHYLSTKT